MGRDNVAGRWEAPSVMTRGEIQVHALELGMALALAILEMISRWVSSAYLQLDTSAVAFLRSGPGLMQRPVFGPVLYRSGLRSSVSQDRTSGLVFGPGS
jgi:hypothetical protein